MLYYTKLNKNANAGGGHTMTNTNIIDDFFGNYETKVGKKAKKKELERIKNIKLNSSITRRFQTPSAKKRERVKISRRKKRRREGKQ